jgi:hypothetical protein
MGQERLSEGVRIAVGEPRIAADLLQRASRQSRAKRADTAPKPENFKGRPVPQDRSGDQIDWKCAKGISARFL